MNQFFSSYARCGLILALASLIWAGCGEVVVDTRDGSEPGEPPRTYSHNIVEPVDGYPSYVERLVLYFTNRARTEPDAFNPAEPYPPSPPLRYDLNLSKAARWQSQHIIEESCWCADHSSCCEIGETNNGIECLGASSTCGITSVGDRVAFFSSKYSGENAAQGYPTALAAVDGWIHSSGHWQNMNSTMHNLLGAGEFQRGWVQVFGRDNQPYPLAEDGIHFSSGTNYTFGITYYQPGTGGPQAAMVIVNGECRDLELAHGKADHGAFEVTRSLDTGCQRYYFHFTDGRGDEHTFPPYGSFGIAVGNAQDCPFFSPNRPADTCSPSGQTCTTGDTRHCYTGPFGTQGVGICKAGVERCIGGQWTGECRNQVHPQEEEVCGNELDDTCSGEVDDGCPVEDVEVIEDEIELETEEGVLADSKSASNEKSSSCALTGGSNPNNPVHTSWLVFFSVAAILARRHGLRLGTTKS